MLKKNMVILIFFSLLIGLFGCSPSGRNLLLKKTPTDSHEILRIIRMSDGECTPPCWMGIIPQETTFQRALEVLEGLDYFTDDGFIRIWDEPLGINWYAGGGNMVNIEFEDGIVYSVNFSTERITLGDVIQYYGPPEFYSTHQMFKSYGISIYYPQKGLVILAYQPSSNPISERMSVDRIFFVRPASIDDFLDEYIHQIRIGLIWIDNFPEDYYSWEGFGVCPRGLSSDFLCED